MSNYAQERLEKLVGDAKARGVKLKVYTHPDFYAGMPAADYGTSGAFYVDGSMGWGGYAWVQDKNGLEAYEVNFAGVEVFPVDSPEDGFNESLKVLAEKGLDVSVFDYRY